MFTELGYYIEVTTYENDADNYKSVVKKLSGAEIQKIVPYIKMFRSSHSRDIKNSEGNICLGNKDIPGYNDDPHVNPIKEIVWEAEQELGEELWEVVEELIGWWDYGERYRVMERYKVYYCAAPVADMTQFYL